MPQSFVFTRPRSPEDSYVFAGAVCREGEQQFYYDWLQKDVAPTDEARIISIDHGTAPDPIKKFEMGRTARKAWDADVCEFCQRNETQVKRLIRDDENRPGICSDCVELCNEILRGEPQQSTCHREWPVPLGQPVFTLTILYKFDIFRIMKSKDAITSLAALAQESRLAIFRMLVKRGPEGYSPTQLGEKLNVSSPTLSFHLKELQRAGLVDVRRDGRFLYYRPNFAHMNQLIGFLTENCCVLADKGCGPECAPAEAEVPLTKRQRA